MVIFISALKINAVDNLKPQNSKGFDKIRHFFVAKWLQHAVRKRRGRVENGASLLRTFKHDACESLDEIASIFFCSGLIFIFIF